MSNLDKALKAIDDAFGKGSLRTLDADPEPLERISIGSALLNQALGGGVAKGRITEIIGPESSGKTTLLYHLVANAQPGTCVFIDTEHSLDPIYASRIGVDTKTLLVSQPDCAEDALGIANEMADHADLIVLDSVAALAPRAELQGEIGDAVVGVTARLMNQFLRVVTGKPATLVLTNQIRHNIGQYGSPETTPGGRGLRFYASQRIDLRRTDTITHAGEATGIKVRATVKKNKTAAPYKKAEFTIGFGTGIDQLDEQLTQALIDGTMAQDGAWFKDTNGNKYHGRQAAKEALA